MMISGVVRQECDNLGLEYLDFLLLFRRYTLIVGPELLFYRVNLLLLLLLFLASISLIYHNL
jgi:hypothetical protein